MRSSATWTFVGVGSLAIGCFSGANAKGLPCLNDAQCGTRLTCDKAQPQDEQGVCGGAAPDTDETSTDATGSDASDTGVAAACGAPRPALCQGVAPLGTDIDFRELSYEDDAVRGNIAVAVGRFAGNDSLEDVAVLSFLSAEVSVFENAGDDTFERGAIPLPTPSYPYDLAAGDFDCDGNTDLAAVAQDGAQLVFAYGAGATIEAFDLDNPRAVPGVWSLAVADFDQTDPGPDLLVACDTQSLLIPGLGGRAFGESRNLVSGLGPWSVTTGDLDDDGIPDAVIANTQEWDFLDAENNDLVSIALSTNGFATTAYAPESFTNPIDTAILEFDGNPGLDVAVLSKQITAEFTVSTMPGILSFHRNDGTGSLSAFRGPIEVGVGAGALATADFNCDGATDIAVGHDAGVGVWILWGPDFVPEDHTEVARGASVGTRMEVADLDRDGYPDLVVPDLGMMADTGNGGAGSALWIVWKAGR